MFSRRYPLVRQNDQSDCGPATLASVARHHGIPVSLEQMRNLAGTDGVGTNLLGMVQAAEKLGFSARACKGPFDALPSVPLPAIAHIKNEEGLGHFVVLYQADKKGVVLADPARGIRKLSRDEFCAMWSGYLIVLVPDPKMPRAVPGTAPISPLRRFLALLRPHSPVLIEACLCALLMTALAISSSFFIQHLVDSVLVRRETKLLNALGTGMALVLVFRLLFGLLRQYLLAYIGRKIDLRLMSSYSRHLLGLPMPFFETRRVGEILSRFHDASHIREAISGTTTTVLVDGLLVLVMVPVLFFYDLPLAMVAAAFVPVLIGSALIHQPLLVRRSREMMENAAGLSSHLVEDVSGVETIKAYGAEPTRLAEGESRLVKVAQSNFAIQKLSMSMSTVGLLVSVGAGLAVLWYGGHRVIDGALSIGQLMFFHSLLSYMLGPIERLSGVNLQLQEALVAVDRLFQVLDNEVEPMGDNRKVRFQGIKKAIELNELTFRYGCRSNVLEKVQVRIPAGKTVAIVGESGSGKSTFLKLLMGFHYPTEGSIRIDGVDMRDYELGSLRNRVGLVAQSPFIFNGSVRENIALGRPDAPLEDVLAAAKAAGLEDFINSLPERYETVIGERGANLSGGQAQRLAIARALLRKPEILIFDEATSHLDSATEQVIQKNLKTALAGKTVVLVAHRLSTVKDADFIYALHQGKVVEMGTHSKLMERGGRYASLWQAQTDTGPGYVAPPARVMPPSAQKKVIAL